MKSTLLSVNINKLATLRNSRGQNNPDLLAYTQSLLDFGVRGITIHPRPDERHITKKDTYELSKFINDHNNKQGQKTVEFNIEGYPGIDFIEMVTSLAPDQVTLVPDPPEALTSNAGWKLKEHLNFLKKTVNTFKSNNIRTSLFIDPYEMNNDELLALKEIQPNRVELYTEAFAKTFATVQQSEVLNFYIQAGVHIKKLNIGINAGHDLDQQNLLSLLKSIPEIKEVSIGHALVCESLYDGLEKTVHNYHKIISES